MRAIEAVRWAPDGAGVRIIDQRLLPERLVERDLLTVVEICEAIETLSVRGAPAIGIAGAMGLAVVAKELVRVSTAPDEFHRELRRAAAMIRAARPTAVNLGWAVDRALERGLSGGNDPMTVVRRLHTAASDILDLDREMCRMIGEHGAVLLREGSRVLTHCNAGALATGGIGTALAPVYVARERGIDVSVVATETRPLLQGSRLTAWELQRAGVPTTLVTDNMVASLMRSGGVDLCLVGADRIAANGDVANKIGTYSIAVNAKHHGIPLFVAAPSSTLDPDTETGADIEIEQRSPDEVRQVMGHPSAPADIDAWNPAFDVTPAELIAGIITERGIWRAPYSFGRGTRDGRRAP